MKIDWIEPGAIAASGIPLGARDLQSLQEQGIRAIVTLTEHPLTVQAEITDPLLCNMGFTCLHAPIEDQHPPGRAIVRRVTDFVRQMRAQDLPVLVHCHAGVGRTGTMLHALYLSEGLSLDEAKAQVRQGKPSSQFLMLSEAQRAFLVALARCASQ